jgi:Flp pilus assembly protein TadG
MSIRALLRRFREQPRGQSFVEFALILPVFLVIMSAAVDLGRMAYARVTIANVAREASFQAAQTPTSYLAGQPCTSGSENDNKVICRAILESTGSVITVTPADVALTCSPDCTESMGNTVTVTVTGRFSLLTPVMSVFFGGSTITFNSASTNQIKALPSAAVVPPPPPTPPTPGSVPTPDLIGVDDILVPDLITAATLTVGTRTEAYSAVIPEGSVVSQDPGSGQMVDPGTAVNYVISKGPEPAPDCSSVSAGFSHNPTAGMSPLTVNVSDSSIFNATCPTVWVWDWGDGSQVYVGRNPGSHVYKNQTEASGNVKKFNLTLTVTSGTFTDTSAAVEISVTK